MTIILLPEAPKTERQNKSTSKQKTNHCPSIYISMPIYKSRLYQARLVATENITRTGQSEDTFDSVLTVQKEALYRFKNNLKQPSIHYFVF